MSDLVTRLSKILLQGKNNISFSDAYTKETQNVSFLLAWDLSRFDWTWCRRGKTFITDCSREC